MTEQAAEIARLHAYAERAEKSMSRPLDMDVLRAEPAPTACTCGSKGRFPAQHRTPCPAYSPGQADPS